MYLFGKPTKPNSFFEEFDANNFNEIKDKKTRNSFINQINELWTDFLHKNEYETDGCFKIDKNEPHEINKSYSDIPEYQNYYENQDEIYILLDGSNCAEKWNKEFDKSWKKFALKYFKRETAEEKNSEENSDDGIPFQTYDHDSRYRGGFRRVFSHKKHIKNTKRRNTGRQRARKTHRRRTGRRISK